MYLPETPSPSFVPTALLFGSLRKGRRIPNARGFGRATNEDATDRTDRTDERPLRTGMGTRGGAEPRGTRLARGRLSALRGPARPPKNLPISLLCFDLL